MDDRPQFGDVAAASDVDAPVPETAASDDGLYDRDFFAWTQDRAERLRARADASLDWANLAEEIESLGRNNKNEVQNRLRVLLHHLLKWKYQPSRRCNSWQTTIGEQRNHIEGLIEMSPSLRRYPAERYDWAWRAARREASQQTGLPIETFPETPEFAIDDVLTSGFMPGRPWSPDELIRD